MDRNVCAFRGKRREMEREREKENKERASNQGTQRRKHISTQAQTACESGSVRFGSARPCSLSLPLSLSAGSVRCFVCNSSTASSGRHVRTVTSSSFDGRTRNFGAVVCSFSPTSPQQLLLAAKQGVCTLLCSGCTHAHKKALGALKTDTQRNFSRVSRPQALLSGCITIVRQLLNFSSFLAAPRFYEALEKWAWRCAANTEAIPKETVKTDRIAASLSQHHANLIQLATHSASSSSRSR